MSVRRPSCSMKQGAISARTASSSTKPLAHIGFGHGREIVAADQPDMAFARAIGGSGRAYIARLTVPGVASTETRPERVRSAAGLIAGTVPTKGWPGKASRSASMHQRRGGVAGDDRRSRVDSGRAARRTARAICVAQRLLLPVRHRESRHRRRHRRSGGRASARAPRAAPSARRCRNRRSEPAVSAHPAASRRRRRPRRAERALRPASPRGRGAAWIVSGEPSPRGIAAKSGRATRRCRAAPSNSCSVKPGRVSTARRLSTIFGFFGGRPEIAARVQRLFELVEQAVQLLLASPARISGPEKGRLGLVVQPGLHPFVGHQQHGLGDVERGKGRD